MSTQTTNLKLYKPDIGDTPGVTIPQLASNFDIIDGSLVDIVTNVKKQFGAKGDGVTDDSTAIQNAINSVESTGGTIYFPPGTYNINTPLNLTNITKGIVFKGSGMHDNGTIIYGLTNGIMLDCSGSPYMQIRDIQLKARYESNSSKIGILFARTSVNGYQEFCSLENVKIDLGSITSANNNQGTVGIYNYGAELHRYRNIYVLADTPLAFDGNNQFNLTSPYATLVTGQQSMSECVVDGSSTLTGYANFGAVLVNTVNIKFDNLYMLLGQSVGANNTYAIKLGGSNTTFRMTGHVEGYPKMAYVVGTLYDFQMEISKQIMGSTGNDQIVLDGSTYASEILGGRVSLYPMLNNYAHNVILQSGSNHNGIINCDITLFTNQGLSIPNGYATGTRIKSSDPSPSLSLPTGGYMNGLMVTTQNRIKLYGDLEMLGGVHYTYGGAVPTSGTWNAGDRVRNNFPSAGGYEGWICVTAGTANNTAWAASTAYTVGQQVNTGGNVYQCTTAGTSGTTAPTGTGSSITDGSVVWKYINALAVFKGYGLIQT